ncbi:MAG: hypothetical protein ACK4SY_07285 [Pyrobaculum sp.]
MRWIFLVTAIVAAVSLILWLIVAVVNLSHWLSGGQTNWYEVYYTIDVKSPTYHGELGWAVVGVGPRGNYTIINLKAEHTQVVVYSVIEGKNVYTTACINTICTKTTIKIDLIPFGAREVGTCRHLGREGKLYSVTELPDIFNIIKLPDISSNIIREASITALMCIHGDMLLWYTVDMNLLTIGKKVTSMKFSMNATRIGPYNETRYKEILTKAKQS